MLEPLLNLNPLPKLDYFGTFSGKFSFVFRPEGTGAAVSPVKIKNLYEILEKHIFRHIFGNFLHLFSLFWEALAIVGQDFQLMESYFQGKQVRRNKAELKSKFSREDKAQRSLVNECLKKASLRPLAMNDFITEIEVIPAVASDGNNNLEMAK